MKSYKLYQVDSFTKEKFKGNPAGVVLNADDLTDSQMQQIAREMNNSETAFIIRKDLKDCDVRVRFFTPTAEVPICGHATIAAHYINALENNFKGHKTVLQKTGAGILPVDIFEENGDYKIAMTQGKIKIDKPLAENFKNEIISTLGLKNTDLREDCPVAVASTGHSKVMVAIKTQTKLNLLAPNLSELKNISHEIGCNGYYVFTLNKNETPLVHGRMFAPAIGIAEDPVTGNANGPLGAYLVDYNIVDIKNGEFGFTAVQGEAIGRAGSMQVKVTVKNKKAEKVQIFGNAVKVFSTELLI